MSDKPSLTSRLRDPKIAVPLGVFVFALLLRLIGISWGLANSLHHQSYHPDELLIWGYSQKIDPAHLSFTPGFYNYGTLYLTLLRVLSDMGASYSGYLPNGLSTNVDSFWPYVSLCHLLGRIVTAISGAAMAAGVAVMMRRWTSWVGAMAAGLMVAVAPGHVVHSRFQTVDILAAALLTFSALYALKIVPSPVDDESAPRRIGKWSVLSGLFAGLSAGVKYTGILGLLSLWTALALARPKGWVSEGLKGTLTCIAAFVITTPGVVLDRAAFIRDFTFEMAHTKAGHGLEFVHTSSGYLYQLSNLFVGIGFILTLVSVAGLATAAWKRKTWAIALLAFALVYFMVIGGSEVKFLRYTFPLYIALAAGFGWAMGAAYQKKGLYSVLLLVGFIGFMGLDTGGLRWALIDTETMADQDARDQAGAYLKVPQIGGGKVVGLVSDPWFYTPALYEDTGLPRSAGPKAIFETMQRADRPKVTRSLYPSMEARYDWDPHLLTDVKPDFVVFSNYETVNWERIKRAADPDEKPLVDRYETFAAELKSRYKFVNQFGVSSSVTVPDMMYVTPVISIWKRNDLP